MPKITRALISVFDKSGIVDLAKALKKFNVEIVSTGGTASHLKEHGIRTHSISDVTEFPEIMQGRVKTLHPKLFGGLLALRENASHIEEIEKHGIDLIELVVVNLYPFEEAITKKNATYLDALENIDIGGPALIRASAKNHPDVAVVTSPKQYATIISELNARLGELSGETSKKLAAEAFQLTARYDTLIAGYLSSDLDRGAVFPDRLNFQIQKVQDLRYGENPHQKAALYRNLNKQTSGLLQAKQLHGKELSFNNMLDLNAALGILQEFRDPCAVLIKHTNPCGAAVHTSLRDAYLNARATDPVSAFGSIVGLNKNVDSETASAISETFVEAVLAPGFEPESLQILQSKKNLRLIETGEVSKKNSVEFDIKQLQGALILQEFDDLGLNEIELKVVTRRQPSKDEWHAMKFAWRVVKSVKSNAIVFTTKDRTIGIGAGQMSRVDSVKFAISKARQSGRKLAGTAVASDAFFPFRDGVDAAAAAGATAVIQPGGSIRDDKVIEAANEHNLTMVFTGARHFRH
ncbi:bifunctional phosphoribosylaminoimidazolecarboxamide formyltransferase/IMP cyclohydrolase [candidate division KSB1 bacterium]|nr:bifunctional phosphoribosylaminoimidazolecarboxamide formyltransferase/IMP cyclohydrolase [candidate division KSB1 bacterium]NIR72153.1 bifunctional phosphoribosylaminoimidazolecarboxamide formyltransferase/IMP cyclohydrolase [candidate division KSB1 bacterium]NIS26618.1 bifunctional phosphoribosylaminoimidazolecarboxamide formyltransferase/IMP cyclohydrolase [candidate division KSB1 bacterium]NIT73386.1 bifunctional phosphoribosylaminoimidazolecarboxamide formyltransferase/IMP cyclohydrolase